eukprot:scaffold317908_cov17-Prasinocladus_malaysianus.AAC.1
MLNVFYSFSTSGYVNHVERLDSDAWPIGRNSRIEDRLDIQANSGIGFDLTKGIEGHLCSGSF